MSKLSVMALTDEDKRHIPSGRCPHCNYTKTEVLHSNYKGCTYCRNAEFGENAPGYWLKDAPAKERQEYAEAFWAIHLEQFKRFGPTLQQKQFGINTLDDLLKFHGRTA